MIVWNVLLITVCDSIVQNAPIDVLRAAYDVCFDSVIRIILQSEDHSEMQVKISCEKLSVFVYFLLLASFNCM